MNTCTAVFCFDLDDTLVSESDYVESGLRAAGAIVDAAAPGRESASEWLVGRWRRDRSRNGFQLLLAERGLHVEPWLQRLKDAYRAHMPVLRLRPGVPEVLAALARRGFRLALVSDGYEDVQQRKWAALAIEEHFDPIVFTDERGRAFWKPHPWAFERVMQAHPSATHFLYVADNPAKDFVAPNRLGWTTVMVCNEANVHSSTEVADGGAPAVTVHAFAALLELELVRASGNHPSRPASAPYAPKP